MSGTNYLCVVSCRSFKMWGQHGYTSTLEVHIIYQNCQCKVYLKYRYECILRLQLLKKMKNDKLRLMK